MKFITLTNAETKKKIRINMDNIIAYRDSHYNSTAHSELNSMRDKKEYFFVIETPEEIDKLIEGSKDEGKY